ncbi:MAG: ImmA/IrrE family metallo-endopeptidase [Gammaproteobacteria bacterium]|nr:ImmA/IrrE family metallo-endopeptidase [Gammaproteobacteria bacterium]
MTRPDDSTLDPDDLRAVEEQAHRLLDRADAWDRYPIPVNDILLAAKVRLAPTSAFDAEAIVSYLKGKATATRARIKSAMSKVFGLYDADEALIHIDSTVVKAKQTFLKLHETGHHDIPWHRKIFRFSQDCRKTLAPEVADQFEREANNFARYLLFKGPTFGEHATDCPLEIKTPIKLARKFGASVYAAAREYARTNPRACVVFVLEPLENGAGSEFSAPVRRIESSPTFCARFGHPTVDAITPEHLLWPVVPIRRRMTRANPLTISDLNGQQHECLAEAFDTTYNILILLYPISALTATTVLMPASPKRRALVRT